MQLKGATVFDASASPCQQTFTGATVIFGSCCQGQAIVTTLHWSHCLNLSLSSRFTGRTNRLHIRQRPQACEALWVSSQTQHKSANNICGEMSPYQLEPRYGATHSKFALAHRQLCISFYNACSIVSVSLAAWSSSRHGAAGAPLHARVLISLVISSWHATLLSGS